MKKLLLAFLLISAPVFGAESYLRLPTDTANVGKMLRMRTSTQGANTVYSQGMFLDDGSGSGPLGLAGLPFFVTFTNSAIAVTGGVAVTGTFWQTTQPVSIVSMPSTPVTGTFWQTTQPVSGTVAVSNFPGTQAVTGTFWQGTQPVSGAFWQATQPVSGTFWQGTQPVSGPLTDTQLRASSVSVICASGCTPGGSFNDSTAFAFGSTAVNNMGAVVDDVATNTVAENSAGAPRMSTNRILFFDLSKTTANTTAILTTGTGGTFPVTGTFWQATQPVSGTFWQATQPVSGTFWQGTQPVSIATMPSTPVTGAFWQATQPVSGTFWQATQPISGTVTSNIGTSGSLALDATLTGGTQKAIARGGAKGTSTAADVTSENVDANTQALHVFLKNTTIGVTGTFWQATQPVSGTISTTQSGTWTIQPGNTVNTTAWLVTGTGGIFPVTGTFWQATQPVSGTFWQATQPVSGTVTANQGTANTAANAWFAKATDGTNTAAVKAASTAAVATDPAFVVVSSPNGGNPCDNPSATLVGIAGATSGTVAVQLVALSGSTKIYLCAVNITGISGTTPTFSLKYGTGTACATGGVTILGAWTTAANTVYTFYQPFVTPAGQELCYLNTGTTPIQNYAITYVQQ
jgi:hypothetical protein